MKIYKRRFAAKLRHVPAKGEKTRIHAIGTHLLGAQIVDDSKYITPALTDFIDKIMQKITGFYYGRIDVKYHSYEDILNGGAFKVMEFNGIGSIPLQIYANGGSYTRTNSVIKECVHLMEKIAAENKPRYNRKQALRIVRKNIPSILLALWREHFGGAR